MYNLMFVGSLIPNFDMTEFKSKSPEKIKQHTRMLLTASSMSGFGWLRSRLNLMETSIFSLATRERVSIFAARLSMCVCGFVDWTEVLGIGVEIEGGSRCTTDRSSSETSSSVPLPGKSVADPKYAWLFVRGTEIGSCLKTFSGNVSVFCFE